MKKLFALVCILLLVLPFPGCGTKEKEEVPAQLTAPAAPLPRTLYNLTSDKDPATDLDRVRLYRETLANAYAKWDAVLTEKGLLAAEGTLETKKMLDEYIGIIDGTADAQLADPSKCSRVMNCCELEWNALQQELQHPEAMPAVADALRNGSGMFSLAADSNAVDLTKYENGWPTGYFFDDILPPFACARVCTDNGQVAKDAWPDGQLVLFQADDMTRDEFLAYVAACSKAGIATTAAYVNSTDIQVVGNYATDDGSGLTAVMSYMETPSNKLFLTAKVCVLVANFDALFAASYIF